MSELHQTQTSNAAILLRTHYFDGDVERFADRLQTESGLPFFIVADESNGELVVPDRFRKIGINLDMLGSLDLFVCSDWGWRCGDYFLIAASQILPDFDYFWLIEPDVRINFSSFDQFFTKFTTDPQPSLIAPAYGLGEPDWFWYNSMRRLDSSAIMRCLFPLVMVSRDLIRDVHKKRIEFKARYTDMGRSDEVAVNHWEWPNDEVIVATIGSNEPHFARDMNEYGTLYSNLTFSFGWPQSAKQVEAMLPDEKIYHSVLVGERFTRKITQFLRNDVQVGMSYEHIAHHYAKEELLGAIVAEGGFNGLERFVLDKHLALNDVVKRDRSAIRKTIIDKLWRGADPFVSGTIERGREQLQGWNSQHPYLREEIARLRPDLVVEVGVWKGGSSIFMAEALRDLNVAGVIIAIDTWLGSWDHLENEVWVTHLGLENGYPTIFRTFMANVLGQNVQDFIVPLPSDSINAAHILSHFLIRPKIVHIDGGHDYRAVISDLEIWWPLLQAGGTLIADDYNDNGDWPEVRLAVDEFVARTNHAGFEFHSGKCKVMKPE